jgi:hypothetical protein
VNPWRSKSLPSVGSAAYKLGNSKAFGLGAGPAAFRNIRIKHLKLRRYSHISDCIDNVHNGTSLASIRIDHLAEATSSMTKPGQPLGRGIN